ncbi:uncharacterized protein LOC130808505 [Amaranthus tricolor]|uniref:uncharacterized protein LOC130808505 n=1 Tax=Amaranthus tricolor TaxID=29722 RepID=UPI00258F5E5F|nr:uncharacterized protein LOC130808505 [Amaranthus tricolor]
MKFDATISQPLQQPYTDQLAVTITIGQMKVRQVLVDIGSTADLITMDRLKKKKFEEKHLLTIDKSLISFGVCVGENGSCKTMSIRFTVVDTNFSYNAIMGLPLINKLKAIISPYQLLLQFEQDDGKVGILKEIKRQLVNALSTH